MRCRALLATIAYLAVVFFIVIGGCAGYNGSQADDMTMAGAIKYIGLAYGPSEHIVSSYENLFYTGDTWNGSRLYVDGTTPYEKIPSLIIAKNISGKYSAYSKLADNPPVYAYMPYDHYNIGENVTFGLMNERGGKVELSNSAPWEIQIKTADGWEPVYHPIAAQMIMPLESGSYKEWTWDQRLDNGSMASFGDYRIVVNGEYKVEFRISKSSPAVESVNANYDNSTIYKLCWNCPQHEAFQSVYHGRFINGTYDYDHNYSNMLLDEIKSEMLFKAYMKGENISILRNALNRSMEHSRGLDLLPCLAVYLNFNGRPSWVIVYNWGVGGSDDYYHIRYYAIDDGTGQILYFTTCR